MVPAKRIKPRIKTDKHDALIAAAIEVFAQKGFSKASVMEIAEQAGVASGTMYLYFRSKDDLLLQAMQKMMTEKLKEIKKQVSKEKMAIDRLFEFFHKHVELFTKHPAMARFLVVELRQSEEFYKRYPSYNPYQEYHNYVQDLVKKAVKEGTTVQVNPTVLSYMLIGTMDNVLHQWLANPEATNLEEIAQEIRYILHNGLRAEKSERHIERK